MISSEVPAAQVKPFRVLITYAWWRASYVVLKSLSGEGCEVYVADYSSSAMCRFSRLSKKFIKIPSSADTGEKFVNYIIGVIKKYRIDLYIPMNTEVLPVAKYIHRFPESVRISLTDYENIRKANNKYSAYLLARKLGVPVPRTVMIRSPEDLSKAEQTGIPAVLKCLEKQAGIGIKFIDRKTQLERSYLTLASLYKGPFILQEKVPGESYGVSCLYEKGKPVAVFTHKAIIEQYIRGGPSTRRVSVKMPMLEECAYKILNSMNWHGIAMLEFLYDEASGKFNFIEINPRFWGSLNLPYISGVNFPYLLHMVAAGREISLIKGDYPEGIISTWIFGDIYSFFIQLLKGKARKDFIFKFLKFRTDGFDVLNVKDIKVFMGEFLDAFVSFLKSHKDMKYMFFLDGE